MSARKSEVWNHYVKESVDKKYECKVCNKRIVSSGNTTNLRNHLRTHKIFLNEQHHVEYKTEMSIKEPSEDSYNENGSPVDCINNTEQQMETIVEDETQTIYLQQQTSEIGEEIEIHNYNSISEVPKHKITYIKPKLESPTKKRNIKQGVQNIGRINNQQSDNNNYNLSRYSKTKQERDDFDSVGEIVAYRLRKLKKLNARKCEGEILNVILSYEMEENDNQ